MKLELATLRLLLRLAQEWKVLDRVPLIRLLRGERNREFVLGDGAEPKYLEACPQPLKDVAILILEAGCDPARPSTCNGSTCTCNLPCVRNSAERALSLTARAPEMLRARKAATKSAWVFPGDSLGAAILGTSIDHQHEDVRDTLKLSKEFVVHSLRHTMLTRLGEAGADAFTIMKIAGHSSVNVVKFEEAKVEAVAAGAETSRVPAKIPTVKSRRLRNSQQVVEITRTGP